MVSLRIGTFQKVLSVSFSGVRLFQSSTILPHFCSHAVENAAALHPPAPNEPKTVRKNVSISHSNKIYGCLRNIPTSQEKLNILARQVSALHFQMG